MCKAHARSLRCPVPTPGCCFHCCTALPVGKLRHELLLPLGRHRNPPGHPEPAVPVGLHAWESPTAFGMVPGWFVPRLPHTCQVLCNARRGSSVPPVQLPRKGTHRRQPEHHLASPSRQAAGQAAGGGRCPHQWQRDSLRYRFRFAVFRPAKPRIFLLI